MLLPVHHFSPQGKMPRAMPPRGIPVSLRGFLYLLVPGGERDREGGSILEVYFTPLPSSQRRHRPSGRMVVPLSRVLIHARKRAERAPCPRTYQRRGIIIVSQTSHPKLQVHILPPLFPSITEKAPPGLSNGLRRLKMTLERGAGSNSVPRHCIATVQCPVSRVRKLVVGAMTHQSKYFTYRFAGSPPSSPTSCGSPGKGHDTW